jgi:uncharacterized protein
MTDMIAVFDRTIARGESVRFRAVVAEMNDGTPVTVPVMVMAGTRPGPIVLLSGAIHGDEYNGPATIHRLFREISPDVLRGTLVGIPIMSPFSFFCRSRSNDLDYEHLNLNRIWPGDPDGFLSQRAAHVIHEQAIRKANVILDFHEGGIAFMARYVALGGVPGTKPAVREAELRMARHFGQGVPIVDKAIDEKAARLGRLGMLSAAGAALDVPVLTIETGGAGTLWPEFIELATTGARRILVGLGMLDGPPPLDDREQVVVREGKWIRPQRGGFLRNLPGMDLGAKVRAGTPMGHVEDTFGDVVDTLLAPFDCIILDTRHIATVYPGDWTFSCGRL